MGDKAYIVRRILQGFPLAALLIMTGIAWGIMKTDGVGAPDLNESQLLQLKNGEVLVGLRQTGQSAKGMVEATILIDAPAESVWRIMIQCRDSPTFIPGLAACQVLESGKNWEIIRHEVKWTWFLPRISYVFRAIYQPYKRIDFARIEGDLKDMRGTWRLTPFGNGRQTLVRYSVFLDPGFFMPHWLVRRSLAADLPAVLTAIRTKVLDR